MAHHKSAKENIRQTARRTVVNKARRNRLRTFMRKVEEAIAGGNRDTAAAALREAQPVLHRSVGKGVLHRNTAARKLSRLTKRIRLLG